MSDSSENEEKKKRVKKEKGKETKREKKDFWHSRRIGKNSDIFSPDKYIWRKHGRTRFWTGLQTSAC